MDLKVVGRRWIQDHGFTDHTPVYGQVLATAKREGYRMISVGEMPELLNARAGHEQGADRDKVLILRHDVDVSPSVARKMRELEISVGADATYYFRLTTLDDEAIAELRESGADIAYHTEELATMVKLTGAREPDDVRALIPAARELAAFNIERFRVRVGAPVKHVSSHGDFTNSRIGITNSVLYDDELRARLNLDFEAYDEELMSVVDLRVSDAPEPLEAAKEVTEALLAGVPVIYFLSHPRRWAPSRSEGAAEEWHRLVEEIQYRRGPRSRSIVA